MKVWVVLKLPAEPNTDHHLVGVVTRKELVGAATRTAGTYTIYEIETDRTYERHGILNVSAVEVIGDIFPPSVTTKQ